jgi:hypothetical protein
MIADILPRYQEIADGTKTLFTFSFDPLDSAYVYVYLDRKEATDYTLSVENRTITFSSAPTKNTKVTVLRAVPIDWDDDFHGAVNKDALNNLLTQMTAKIQTVEEEVSRAVKVNVWDSSVDSEEILQQLQEAQDILAQSQTVLTNFEEISQSAITNYNTNAAAKTTTYNDNAEIKTTAFNDNAESKTDTFNDNAAAKTTAFNSNAESKTDTFNENATDKTDTFNDNAAAKTTAYNENAAAKLEEVNKLASDASDSAKAASDSAAAALTSEQNAKSSENTAAGYATAAGTSASKASTSEQNAKSSETNAGTYASNAKSSETNASDSAKAASTSEQNAKTYAENASSSASKASTSETNAKSSEENAATSETNAKASADRAKTIADSIDSSNLATVALDNLSAAGEARFTAKQDSLTTAQLNAVNSGVTSSTVSQVATNKSDIAKKQDALISGTNIKTINSESILGSGDITIKSAPDLDGKTITKNSSEELQAIGVIDSNSGGAVKTWSGTTDEYRAISTKDANTLYNITDDFTALPGGHDTLPLPLGMILPAVGIISDVKYHLLDGLSIAKDGIYSAFCEEVQKRVDAGKWFACTEDEFSADVSNYGQCGRFVIGDDYVRLPKITRYIGATISLSEIGKAYGAGLPDPKLDFLYRLDSSSSGVYTDTYGNDGYTAVSPATTSGTDEYMQSSNSYGSTTAFAIVGENSIYGSSDTVEVDNVKYPYYMVISTTGQTSEVEVDINKVSEDLAQKMSQADVDSRISEIMSTYVVSDSFMSYFCPDYNQRTVLTTGSDYTLPAVGWILMRNTVYTTRIIGYINGYEVFRQQGQSGSWEEWNSLFVMLDKGSVVKLTGGELTYYPLIGAS